MTPALPDASWQNAVEMITPSHIILNGASLKSAFQ